MTVGIHRPTRWISASLLSEGKRARAFWLCLCVAVSVGYAWRVVGDPLVNDYVVQDDARQHAFWAARYANPEAFPGDFTADYAQSVAPIGYGAVYRLASAVGVDVQTTNKALPLVLGPATAVAAFQLTMAVAGLPSVAFVASFILNQDVWRSDTIVSGIARAFLYVLILGFLIAVLRKSTGLMVLVLVLQVLFYPPTLLLSLGTLGFMFLGALGSKVAVERRFALRMAATGIVTSLVLLALYAATNSSYGPTPTMAEGRSMVEFNPGGRSAFFRSDPVLFWIWGQRSGIFPGDWTGALHSFMFGLLALGAMLPLLVRSPDQTPLMRRVAPHAGVFVHLALASIGMFFAAHLLLFKLYLPSRYTVHTFRIIAAIAGTVALALILDRALRLGLRLTPRRRRALHASIGVLSAALGIAVLRHHPFHEWNTFTFVRGGAPKVYEFLRARPPGALVATLDKEADNIPMLARQSVLTSREVALPYHMGYYREIRRRTLALVDAHYTVESPRLTSFISEFGVDYFLVHRDAFSPEYVRRSWIYQFREPASSAEARLQAGEQPTLAVLMSSCVVVEDSAVRLIDAACIASRGLATVGNSTAPAGLP